MTMPRAISPSVTSVAPPCSPVKAARVAPRSAVVLQMTPKVTTSNRLNYLPHEAFAAAFAPNATPEKEEQLAAIQRPIALACLSVPVGRPLWKDRPSYFLLAE